MGRDGRRARARRDQHPDPRPGRSGRSRSDHGQDPVHRVRREDGRIARALRRHLRGVHRSGRRRRLPRLGPPPGGGVLGRHLGPRAARRGPRLGRHRVHATGHRGGLRRHRPDQARRLRRLRLAQLLGTVLLLPSVPDRVPRRGPSSLHARPLLPAVAAVLALEHRQGSLDAVHARHRRLRRGARPDLPAARVPRARHRARRHCRCPSAHHAARVRRLLPRLSRTAPIVAGLSTRPARAPHRPRRDRRRGSADRDPNGRLLPPRHDRRGQRRPGARPHGRPVGGWRQLRVRDCPRDVAGGVPVRRARRSCSARSRGRRATPRRSPPRSKGRC